MFYLQKTGEDLLFFRHFFDYPTQLFSVECLHIFIHDISMVIILASGARDSIPTAGEGNFGVQTCIHLCYVHE